MHPRLYFLDLLNRALDEDNLPESLAFALQEIRRYGGLKRYALGLQAFQDFMAIACQTGSPQVSLLLDGQELASISANRPVQLVRIAGIVPGTLTVLSGSGRLLWGGELTEADLLWSLAFPSSDLPAAAQSEAFASTHSREIEVLPRELFIRVCPGLTTGSLRVLITMDTYNETDKEDYWSSDDSPGL